MFIQLSVDVDCIEIEIAKWSETITEQTAKLLHFQE